MWIKLALSILFNYVASLFQKKPPPPKAAGLDDFNIPRSEEGEEAGIIFGTVWIKSPQVVWHGDLRSVAIKDGGGKK